MAPIIGREISECDYIDCDKGNRPMYPWVEPDAFKEFNGMTKPQTTMRRFILERLEDETGVSGTGVVAEGVEFWDGTCALRWKTKHRCSAIYDSILVLEAIHGHGGKTKVIWID